MKLLINLIDILKNKRGKTLPPDQVITAILIGFSSIFLILFLILYLIVGIIYQNYIIASFLGFMAILVFANYRASLHSTNISRVSNIFLLLSIFILASLFLTGGAFGTGYLWSFMFPVLSVGLKGVNKGGVASLGYLAIITAISIVSSYLPFIYTYEIFLSLRIIGVYLSIHLMLFIYEYLKKLNSERLKTEIEENSHKLKMKDDFLSKLSHQIRTPLNNITLINTLVNQTKFDPEQRDLFETIIASSNNLVDVVNNIVKVSTVELDEKVISKVPYNLNATIENTLKIFEAQHKEELIINLENSVKDDFIGDPVRIKQLFLTLIENFIKTNTSDKKLELTIAIDYKKKDNHNCVVYFKVINPNYKILEDNNDYYFVNLLKDFNPEDDQSSNMIYDFTIAKKIIDLHNGSLDFGESGCLFSFSLTLNKAEQKSQLTTTEPEQEEIIQKQITTSLSEANILLVEDNSINQKIVLLSLKGKVKNIDLAGNGKEALDKFGTTRYDLILMDIQMPVMNGIVATKKIRELESSTNLHTPIIAITANALSGDKEACIAAGMNDYISKPFQVEVLLKKMENLLSEQ
jgi:CheY-like chemotaxis protein/signal transduction histidine kinase